MKNFLFSVVLLFGGMSIAHSQGTSCANAMSIYPDDNCDNADGAQYEGEWQCPNAQCGAYQMTGSSGGLNPACTSDDETSQSVLWVAITATAGDITINQSSAYTGAATTGANTKDFVLYSGTCGSLTQIACYTLDGNDAQTITGLTAGQVYYMMVSPSSGDVTAAYTNFCITSTVGYSPPNNSCATATVLSTNVTIGNTSNAGATIDGPGAVCLGPASGSVENNVWYQWCAPSTWPAGQLAYISVAASYCNATGGLQIGVFGANQTCAALTSSLVCQNPGSVSSFYYQWTAAANQCYYINVDGFAGTACNYSITAGSIIVLPIELLSFDVNAVGNKSVDLSWATASEKNNDYFTVERSQNGTSFELVEVVDGAGNSTALLNYASKDVKPLAGTTYYRLKQTDYDGRISYSSIKEVTIDMNADLNFTIYPNPSGENDNPYLAFSGNSDETVTISIYDVTGKMMSQKSVRLDQAGNSAIELKQTFVSGIYFVNASSASGKSINQKLIIK